MVCEDQPAADVVPVDHPPARFLAGLRAALDAGALPIERARQLGEMSTEEQQTVADAGPPYKAAAGGNGVTTAARRRPTIPVGDPAAAARSIREVYTGEQLTELVRLLSVE